MTSLYSTHPVHNHPPPDQPTPQSPGFYMSTNHDSSPNIAMDKHQHQPAVSTVTPPSSFHSQHARQQQQQPTIANAFPTPASSAAGTVPPTTSNEDMDGDMIMTDGDASGSGGESGSHKRKRTSPLDQDPATIAPGLRHRSKSTSSHDEPTPKPSPPIPTIQELLSQPDVSPYYLVAQKTTQPAYPILTENLLSIYGLKPLCDTVARRNVANGTEGVKLRKSYKGHITDLPGRNVVEPVIPRRIQNPGEEYVAPVGLLGLLLRLPEEEYYNRELHGKDISKGIDMGKLKKGLNMAKGDIPGFNPAILGLDEEIFRKTPHLSQLPPSIPVAATTTTTPHINGSTPGNDSSVSAGARPEDRPRRKKRRRYDEGSYEGYDTFDGDEDTGAGANTGNGPGGGVAAAVGVGDGERKKKKKKRDHGINSPAPGMNNIPHRSHSSGISVHGGSMYGR